MNEVAGVDFYWSPSAVIESDTSGVEIEAHERFYAVLGCESQPMTATARVASTIAPGTLVTLTARVDMDLLCPNAPAIAIPIRVK